MEKLLQIAIDKCSGTLISVYDLDIERIHNCICPGCGADLVAINRGQDPAHKKPREKTTHFRHSNPCEWAPETAIHLLAKKVLMESKILLLPELVEKGVKLLQQTKEKFDFAFVEEFRGEGGNRVKPDIILVKQGKEFFVEFCKTNPVHEDKYEKIKKLNITCLEIDLNEVKPIVDGKLNIEGLRELFEDETDTELKRWVYHSKKQSLYEEYLKSQKEQEEAENIKQAEIWNTQNSEEDYSFDYIDLCDTYIERRNQVAKIIEELNDEQLEVVPIFGRSEEIDFRSRFDLRYKELSVQECKLEPQKHVKKPFLVCKNCSYHQRVYNNSVVICSVKKELFIPKSKEFYKKAVSEIESGKLNEAIGSLSEAEKYGYKPLYKVLYLTGVVAFKLGFFEKAAGFFHSAIKSQDLPEKDKPKIYYYWGLSVVELGYKKEGIKLLEDACKLGYEDACKKLKE